MSTKTLFFTISRDGARTHTGLSSHRILSPVRLPVSPLGQVEPMIVAWVRRHCKTVDGIEFNSTFVDRSSGTGKEC